MQVANGHGKVRKYLRGVDPVFGCARGGGGERTWLQERNRREEGCVTVREQQ